MLPRKHPAPGFTLIELLVVIGVITILAALLFAAVRHVQEAARQSTCASNLRQIAIAALAYAAEHDGALPAQPGDGLPVKAADGSGENYYDLLMPYLKDSNVWMCPSSKNYPGRLMGYHMNGLLVTKEGLKLAAIERPARTLLVTDAGEKRRWDQAYLRPDHAGNYLYDVPINTHNGGGNVAMADGHVEWFHDSRWNAESFKLAP